MNTIEIKNLNKKIKGAEVLKDINLHLEGGKVYGLKGKNGSGKTMLMRAVCGLILPTGGSITINGEQLGKQISFPRSVGIRDLKIFRCLPPSRSVSGKMKSGKRLKRLA